MKEANITVGSDLVKIFAQIDEFNRCGLSPKFLPATSRALGRFEAHRWA